MLAAPALLAAQATVTVPLQDPVYRDLDRLFGAGAIKTMVVGVRPYSRREIARIVRSALDSAAGARLSAANSRILERLAAEYARELAGLRGDPTGGSRLEVQYLRAEALATNEPGRAIPYDTTGHVEADLSPLRNGRAGRVYRAGINASAEADLSYRFARSFIVRAAPRMMVNENAAMAFAQGSLEAASLTALWRNVTAEIGRQQFVWGQGSEGGLLGSSSGRPLDMIRIANDTPFHLWPFGPARGSLIFVDLGPNQRFPHSNIIAYKLVGNPWTSRVEFGVSVLSEQGGRGAIPASMTDHLVDIIPAIKYLLKSKNNAQFSNKFAGWEYRLRLPELSGLQLYAEHQFDDMDSRRWKSTFWEDAGHIAGFSFAELGSSNVGFGGEFHHTGLRYYEHTPFTTGVSFNRTLLGDPLGPKADGGYAHVTWDAGGASTFAFHGAVERRLGNVYTAYVDGAPPHETNFRFVVVEPRPDEWRHRAAVTWTYRSGARWRAAFEGGWEQAGNYAFVKDATRHAFLASASVELLRW